MVDTKECHTCGKALSLTEFYANRKDCKECVVTASNAWKKAHPEQRYETNRQWQLSHREKMRESSRKCRANHPEQTMLTSSKIRARNLGLEHNIELSDIVIPEFCPVLGIKIVIHHDGKNGPSFDSPSLDRIDSTKGYIKGNVWVISWRANHVKNDATPEELRLVAERGFGPK